MRKYYKYKSLEEDSFKYFVKMLVESKMYAAKFSELNDPMEGAYLSGLLNLQEIENIRYQKDNRRIISMVEKVNEEDKPHNMLMWSHYTDEHRGCCVEFHFSREEDEKKVKRVDYIGKMTPNDNIDAEAILCRKFSDWHYEEEVRYIGEFEGENKTVPIVIDKIYLGMRIDNMYGNDNSEEVFLRELINRVNPEIIVDKMRAEDFDHHHLDTLKE